MFRRITNLFVLGMTLCLAIAFASCGGGGPAGPRAAKDGRVFVRNDSDVPLEVSYFNEELGEVIKTVVKSGETEEVSQAVIQGGTKITLTIVGREKYMSSKDVNITIDGNVTVWVKEVGAEGEMTYEII